VSNITQALIRSLQNDVGWLARAKEKGFKAGRISSSRRYARSPFIQHRVTYLVDEVLEKGVFFNGWKESYEAYSKEAREKASQLLFGPAGSDRR